MRRDPRKFLYDIRQAAERLGRFAEGKTLNDYRTNDMLRSAVERQFEIIGEALGQLLKVDAATAQKIAEHHRIIAFRNILIHMFLIG